MPRRVDLLLANRSYLDHSNPPSAAAAAPAAAAGGLVTAVRSVISPWDGASGTTWIGAGRGRYDRDWTDGQGIELLETAHGPLRHRRLYFDDETWLGHYGQVANGFLWPLLHLVREDLPERTAYYPAPAAPSETAWEAYAAVNSEFASAAMEEARDEPICWVHDYQLALVPGLLRAARFPGRVGFFLHTPFPALSIADRYLGGEARACFASFVQGIAGADLAGFQTESDARRFREAATGLGIAQAGGDSLVLDGRRVRAGAYPVGIDTRELADEARTAELSPEYRRFRESGVPLVIGLERADYTKGIPERLEAIRAAYREGIRFAYLGAAAPTRAGVDAYDRLAAEIQTRAAAAGAAAAACEVPFAQLTKAIPWEQVVALQREAGVVFTSSLADGMNLVPLQAVIAQASRPAAERGTIIAGRDAGVAAVYHDSGDDGLVALDPLDSGEMLDTLRRAVRGELAPISDRLIAAVRTHDAHAWASHFLADLEAAC